MITDPMIQNVWRCFLLMMLIALIFCPSFAVGADMREVARKAREGRVAAESAARAAREAMLGDREKIIRHLQSLEAANTALKSETNQLRADVSQLSQEKEALSQERGTVLSTMKSVSGTIRSAARELDTLLTESPFTAADPDRLNLVRDVLAPNRFAGIDDLDLLVNGFFNEMDLAGRVQVERGNVLMPSGELTETEILSIGPFSASFRDDKENVGFLRYLPENRKFQMLGRAPSGSVQKNISAYMDGKEDAVHTDVSAGAALQQVMNRSTLKSQVEVGGFLVWPIIFIGFLALLVTVERLWFLWRVHTNADKVMGRVNTLASEKNWASCDSILLSGKGKPVYNILIAGINARQADRQTLENVLREAILRELPRLERFLPMLNVMAAIAPLIGLLGTVTGMIQTFNSITLFGTGDPRMMSGGISEALITTEFGLAVAIPIMLIHTFLARQVEHVVEDMEEKSVSLCNILSRVNSPGPIE